MLKIIMLLLSICLLSMGCPEKSKVRAIVLSHVVTSDKTGTATYRTIVKTEDGYIQELRGLKFYIIPEGKTITIEVYR